MEQPPVPRRPQPHFSVGDDLHAISFTHDQVLVLFEFLERLRESGEIIFRHPAEYLALAALQAQLQKIPWELFDQDYDRLLLEASARVAVGFEGHVDGLGHVRAEADGSFTAMSEPHD